MNTLQTAFEEWTRQVQLPGTIDQTEATDILQIYAPSITDQEGDDWWLAVATRYEERNIITQPTYVQLRNHANNNEIPANELFRDLVAAINSLPESAVVNAAIAAKNNADNQAEIDGNIAAIEAMKTGGTSVADVQLDAALDEAIKALEAFRVSLQEEEASGQGLTAEAAALEIMANEAGEVTITPPPAPGNRGNQ